MPQPHRRVETDLATLWKERPPQHQVVLNTPFVRPRRSLAQGWSTHFLEMRARPNSHGTDK